MTEPVTLFATACTEWSGAREDEITVLLDDGTRRPVPAAALSGLRRVHVGQRLALALDGERVQQARLPAAELRVQR